MYKAIYREYRPEVFDEMLGQEHIVKILKNQVAAGTVNHAYLFCGTRGTGKTTTARLLAKAVNCLSDGDKPCGECANCKAIKEGTFLDLVEIDAASNNGIDDIRELRESINFPPAVGKKKVYIIDEVHMLTKGAFNGFLKTLEEPPEHVMFILATTEPQDLPQTILSRCIRMDFRRVSEKALIERMGKICEDRNITVEPGALALVAANADGSVRDGLTLLDQCISGRDDIVTRDEVLYAIGAVGEETYIELTNAIINKNVSDCVLILNKIFEAGKDARQVLMGLMNHYRNLLLTKYVKKPENMLNMSLENVERVRAQSEVLDLADINDAIIELSQMNTEIRNTTQPRILLELVVVKLASGLAYSAPALRQVRPQENVILPKVVTAQRATDVKIGDKNTLHSQEEVEVSNPNAPFANADMETVWDNICQEAAQKMPALRTLRKCTIVHSMTPGEIVIQVTNDTIKGFVEEKKQMLVEISRELTGTAKHISILDSKQGKREDKSIEEVAERVEDILGISVEIK